MPEFKMENREDYHCDACADLLDDRWFTIRNHERETVFRFCYTCVYSLIEIFPLSPL